MGMAGFIIPFMFIWCPGLLLDFTVDPVPLTLMKMVACFLLLLELQMLLVGHYVISLNVRERVICGICSILTVLSIYHGNIILFIMGTIMFIGLTLWQYKNQKAAIRLSASLSQDGLKLGA